MACRLQGQCTVEFDQLTALHDGGDLERIVLPAFAEYLFENFVNGDHGHEKIPGTLNGGGTQ